MIDALRATYLGNSLLAWIAAAVVAGISLVGLRLVLGLLASRLRTLAARTTTELDDLLTDLLDGTRFFFYLFVALYLGSRTLTLPATVDDFLWSAFALVLLLQGAFWANAAIGFMVSRARDRQLETDPGAATTLGALGFVGRLVVWSLTLLLALDNLGFDITTLVAGLGIGGVALALAVQNILGDLFASLSIVLDKPFVVGDFIIVGEFMGTVEYVGLKTTRVRSLGGEQLVFANSDLLESRIRNYKRMDERRILFSFGVVYQTPYDRVKAIPEIVREIVEAQENTRFDRAHFKGYGDSALDFEVVYYMLVPDYNIYMDTQEAINLGLLRRFEEEGIDFAYPTRTVIVTREELEEGSPGSPGSPEQGGRS